MVKCIIDIEALESMSSGGNSSICKLGTSMHKLLKDVAISERLVQSFKQFLYNLNRSFICLLS